MRQREEEKMGKVSQGRQKKRIKRETGWGVRDGKEKITVNKGKQLYASSFMCLQSFYIEKESILGSAI